MKTSVKIFSIVMTAFLALSMLGCSANKANIKELKKNNGIMLTIESLEHEPMTEEMQGARSARQTVTYRGAAINPDQADGSGLTMTDEDYMKIYNFCAEAVAKNKFADYKEDVCDGTTYKFTFYDTNGEKHVIYNGYIYDNEELKGIREIISRYSYDG